MGNFKTKDICIIAGVVKEKPWYIDIALKSLKTTRNDC